MNTNSLFNNTSIPQSPFQAGLKNLQWADLSTTSCLSTTANEPSNKSLTIRKISFCLGKALRKAIISDIFLFYLSIKCFGYLLISLYFIKFVEKAIFKTEHSQVLAYPGIWVGAIADVFFGWSAKEILLSLK